MPEDGKAKVRALRVPPDRFDQVRPRKQPLQDVQHRAHLHHDQARRRPPQPGGRHHQAIRAEGIQARRHEVHAGNLNGFGTVSVDLTVGI